MFNDGRFSNIVGEEYDIFYDAVPHILELQHEVGERVKQYIDTRWSKDFAGPITVYEGGCGTGTTTAVLLAADQRIHVVAIDNEKTMLDQMRQKFASVPDRITFVHDDIVHALQGAQNIDIFVSGFMIHNMQPSYRGMIFSALGTAMRSGGFFINADKIARDDELLHKQDFDAEIELIQYFAKHGLPKLTEEWTAHYIEDDKIRFTEHEQTQLLQQAGFTDISFPERRLFDVIAIARKV